jgi:hypothetical protein
MDAVDDAAWDDAPVRCRAVIFDLDGTLLDTGSAHAALPRRVSCC